MPATNVLFPGIPNTTPFHSLALFICHLFIDGKFRSGHVLYEPNALDDRIFTEIKSICPEPMPWQTIDITQFKGRKRIGI